MSRRRPQPLPPPRRAPGARAWGVALALASLLAGALAACAGDQGYLDLGPLRLEVSYHGLEGCPLEELRLHRALDDYGDATNLLGAPLEVGDATWFDGLAPGPWYVTVIRCERPLPGSPRVALTTASPLDLQRGLYALKVFEDFFRLVDPVRHPDATNLP